VVGYPSRAEEQLIIQQQVQGIALPKVEQVVSTKEIIDGRALVKAIYMDDKIEQYIIDVVFATRFPQEYGLSKLAPLLSYGGSPRASINLALAAKAHAFLNKWGFVISDEGKAICNEVLRNRIGVTYEAEAENITAEMIVSEIVQKIAVP